MKEKQIHDAFIAWLKPRGVIFHHSRTDRKTSMAKGDPDFILTYCGRVLYLEIKVGRNTLSEDQEQRIKEIRAAGNRVEICWSVEECVEAAKTILCEAIETNEPPQQPDAISRESKPFKTGSDLFRATWGSRMCVFKVTGEKDTDVVLMRFATPADERIPLKEDRFHWKLPATGNATPMTSNTQRER